MILNMLAPGADQARSQPTRRRLPSPTRQAGTVSKYEVLGNFSSRRFVVLLAIVVAIGSTMTAAVAYEGVQSFGSTPLSFYSAWYFGGVTSTYVVVFCAIFFGGDTISGEFQNRSGYFLAGNPVSRASIFIGKYVGALLASLLVVAAFAGVTLANGIYYFGTGAVPVQFAESLLFQLAFLISALALTLLFSSLFKSGSTSILVTAILLFFGFFILVALVGGRAHVEPTLFLTYGSDIIGSVLSPAGYPPHIVTSAAGLTTFNATIPEGLEIMAAYFAGSTTLGIILFQRKEFS